MLNSVYDNLVRKFLLFIFFFLLFLRLSPSNVLADWDLFVDPVAAAANIETTQEANDYLFGSIYGIQDSSGGTLVTEHTRTVHIRFSGLTPGQEYDICLSTNCLLITGETKGLSSLIDDDAFFADVKTDKKPANANGDLDLYVCATGENSLRIAGTEVGTQCDEKDYFHGRHLYGLVIGTEDGIVESAPFYVSMYYPYAYVRPSQIKPGEQIKVYINGTKPPHNSGKRNNYAVEIAKADNPSHIFDQQCTEIEPSTDSNFNPDEIVFDGRTEGDYLIKINEQAHEGGWKVGRSGCSAEFTYYWILIRVRDAKYWDENPTESSVIEIITDPNGADVPGGKKAKKSPPPPCAEYDRSSQGSLGELGNCTKVKTAIGDIGTSASDFIGSVFSIILGLSGGLAILLIIYGGYQLMASRGKPEAMEAARDQITAAIIGLLFIIFAFVILQVIGVDILKIPGFEGPDPEVRSNVTSPDMPSGSQKSLFQ